MGSYSRTILVGNLTKDAVLRATPGGAPVATFTLATNETWTDKATGERKERAEFHQVKFWGQGAKAIAPFLVKGKQVAVEGKNETHKWQDKTGADRWSTEVKADRVVLLGSRQDGGQRAADASQDHEPAGDPQNGYDNNPADNSDIPY